MKYYIFGTYSTNSPIKKENKKQHIHVYKEKEKERGEGGCWDLQMGGMFQAGGV